METFKAYMYRTDPKNERISRLFSGIFGIIMIILYFQFDIFRDAFSLFIGTICIFFAIAYNLIIKRNFILVDDEGIKAEFVRLDEIKLIPPYLRRLNKVYTKWEEIQSVSKEPLNISITLKSGNKKEIYIGDLSYKNHQELKTRLKEYLEEKGITITE